MDGLSFEGYADFDTTQAIISNLSEASLDVSLRYEPGEVSIQYVYLPSGPRILGYAREGQVHRIRFGADEGINDWRIFGGADLGMIDTDHTANAVLSETSPGVYDVEVTLPDLEEETYFITIGN